MFDSRKSDIPIQKANEGRITGRLFSAYERMRAGIITPFEFMLMCFDKGISLLSKFDIRNGDHLIAHRIIKKLRSLGNVEQEYYKLGNARIPSLDKQYKAEFFSNAIFDVFYCYMHLNDSYEEININKYFYIMPEGPYCIHNDLVDVRINAGDIVIDAGSWIGDFAAYASVKGATVYAFEPSDDNYDILLRTASLNTSIFPIKKALGSSSGYVNMLGHSGSAYVQEDSSGRIEETSIDNFVHENNLQRVDFIKCDIEGFERHMLTGAQETLARFAPKLALCTYHLPDDPEVMASLIKQANPKYNIVQKRKKLFASVPEN